MENKEILQRLLGNLKTIQAIRTDDGYVIHRIASIGRASVELFKQLKVDEEEKALIIEAIEELEKRLQYA